MTALDKDTEDDLEMKVPLRGPILLAALAALAAAAELVEAGALPCPPHGQVKLNDCWKISGKGVAV